VKYMASCESGAIFSDCMKYRYRLWRCWNQALPRALFILLNPSTADDIDNDATIERQQRRVMMWSNQSDLFSGQLYSKKFGSIEVVNACAYRSTNPEVLFKVSDPVGDDNLEHIITACKEALRRGGIIICGWGKHLAALSPGGRYTLHELTLERLEQFDFPLTAFQLNGDRTPKHPLYVSYELKPRRWFNGALHEEVV